MSAKLVPDLKEKGETSGSPETEANTAGEPEICPSCRGTRQCATCQGTGLWYANTLQEENCLSCRGSGRCPRCDPWRPLR